jgi:hypothetical protein
MYCCVLVAVFDLTVHFVWLPSLRKGVGNHINGRIRSENGERDDEAMPFFPGLGDYGRPIATTSVIAQRYFDQGLAFLYAFNHEAAIKSFVCAAKRDPRAPMPLWGIAMANGPHINNMRLDAVRARTAQQAITQALRLAENATPEERVLIFAASKRFSDWRVADRRSQDAEYAE